ncbi:MAG: hypothetical protein ACTSU7_06990 [Candidatus Heimdallarchaeaceae archaeon]
MKQKIKEMCNEIAIEAMKGDVGFLLDDVKFSIIEGVLARSSSIIVASQILGISRGSIQLMKKNGFISDVKRFKGKVLEDLV